MIISVFRVILVGEDGIEPTHHKEANLQSAAPLLLRRSPRSFVDVDIMSSSIYICIISEGRTMSIIFLHVRYAFLYGAPGRTRTDTSQILSLLTLPLAYGGNGGFSTSQE